MRRDFTFVEDTVAAVARLIDKVPEKGQPVAGDSLSPVADSLSPVAPWRSVNIAGGRPVELMAFIEAIEAAMGREAHKNMLPMQAGDVTDTAADVSLLRALVGDVPQTAVADGVRSFVDWWREWRG